MINTLESARYNLHTEITTRDNLLDDNVIKRSQELDKLIVCEQRKKLLNIRSGIDG